MKFSKKIALFFLLIIWVFGCDVLFYPKLQKHGESRYLFGTAVRLEACYEKSEEEKMRQGFAKAWQRLDDIQVTMNNLDKRSDVEKINSAKGRPVKVGQDMYELLKRSVDFSRLTGGAFDITVCPLIELWADSEKNNTVPSDKKIKEIRKFVGADTIQFLPGYRIKLSSRRAKIDINGVACGYAADEAGRILRENGLANFLVDTGGEFLAWGKNCEGTAWQIGIRDPQDLEKITDALSLQDKGISTSGNYSQFYEIKGERWSKIINPLTGYPEAGIVSATVIAPDGTSADALSTALCVLGGLQGIRLIDSLGEPFAAVITEKKGDQVTLYQSRGYPKFLSRKMRPQ